MSKKNTKPKNFSPYRYYGFDRNFANSWNDMCYDTWLIADEGQEKPDPQRLTNFICKYGKRNKRTGKSILSYIPKDYRDLMFRWVSLTKAEHKQAQSVSKENINKKIIGWLHQAEIMYWNDINKN